MATNNEKDAILSHLLDYADDCRFRLLAARDYGSRARGLESESSDYDIFFIYAQPPADYALGADAETYTKEIPAEESLLDTEIELHGWNLQRFIGSDGLKGSNPTAIEFCASPEEYYMDDTAAPYMQTMCEHAYENFKPYALMNHYRSLSASNYGKYIEGDYKLTSDTSYDDLLKYSNPDWHMLGEVLLEECSVSEEESEINTDHIGVFVENTNTYSGGSIEIDRALDAGLIEPTTLDRTNKRYLNIAQALLKSRYIEETHECPPMEASALLRWAADKEWLNEDEYARIGTLIAGKTQDGAIETGSIPACNDFIERELGREIEIEPHVQRQPETHRITGQARDLYNSIDWFGTI